MSTSPGYDVGDVVGIAYKGVTHTGIVSHVEPGEVRVIHKSKRRGRVVEEPIGEFASGRTVRRVDYPGHLPPEVVVTRARERIGEAWTYRRNCQRFCAEVHGAPMRSRDADKFALTIFTVSAAVALAARRYG